jgi:hypothetical protein
LLIGAGTREVHFDSAAQMLDFFRLPKDGPHYRRLLQGFTRLFAATIFFGTEEQPDHAAVIDWARFHFFDRMRLWFNHDNPLNSPPADQHNNVIVLSEAFYREIDEHRIPVEREVVVALTHAPGALDLYLWLVWKTWTVNGTLVRIPLFAENGLKNQRGCKEYSPTSASAKGFFSGSAGSRPCRRNARLQLLKMGVLSWFAPPEALLQ